MSKNIKVRDSKPVDKYWKQIRSNIKNTVRESSSLEDLEDLEIPDTRIVVNDYDTSEWKSDRKRKTSRPRKIFDEDFE